MSADYSWYAALRHTIRKNKRTRENSYFHLATVAFDGSPSNRAVVFRGFLPGTDSLKIVTDTRSKKVPELQDNPVCEVSWYFSHTREQYRIKARAEIFKQATSLERAESWEKLSEQARAQFFWPMPGKVYDPQQSLEQDSDLDLNQPPASFTLLILTPFSVDHLQLKGSPQIRRVSVLENTVWKNVDVNP